MWMSFLFGAALAADPSFDQLLREDVVLENYLHMVDTRSGFRIYNSKEKRVNTRKFALLTGNDELLRSVRRPTRVRTAGLVLAAVPIGLAGWTGAIELGVLSLPGGVVYVVADQRLKKTSRWIERDDAAARIDQHNRALLASVGVEKDDIPDLIYRQRLLVMETGPDGSIRVRQGLDYLSPYSFAYTVGDVDGLGRYGLRTTGPAIAVGVLGTAAVVGVVYGTIGGVALLFSPFAPEVAPAAGLLLIGGYGGAAIAGTAALYIALNHVNRNRGYERWYTQQQVETLVEAHNAGLSPEALAPRRKRWIDDVSVHPVLSFNSVGVVGTF
ncbi:MAG: hypothetical protein AAFV53_00935 [Myxococcota bacterium]